MISHANFIKKAVTPDPVHCDDDSTEDYGEIGTFSVTPSEVIRNTYSFKLPSMASILTNSRASI